MDPVTIGALAAGALTGLAALVGALTRLLAELRKWRDDREVRRGLKTLDKKTSPEKAKKVGAARGARRRARSRGQGPGPAAGNGIERSGKLDEGGEGSDAGREHDAEAYGEGELEVLDLGAEIRLGDEL